MKISVSLSCGTATSQSEKKYSYIFLSGKVDKTIGILFQNSGHIQESVMYKKIWEERDFILFPFPEVGMCRKKKKKGKQTNKQTKKILRKKAEEIQGQIEKTSLQKELRECAFG